MRLFIACAIIISTAIGLAGWQGLASDPTIRFSVEDVDVDGDRAVIRWRITGAENYRGVNLLRVRDGKIIEALGYGKRP